MLKGVNKLIIEINNPGSEYFERAILFLKPRGEDIPASKLSSSAEDILLRSRPSLRKKPQNLYVLRLMGFILSGVSGAAIYALVNYLLT